MTTLAISSGNFRLWRRELPRVRVDLVGLEISVGSIQELCERAALERALIALG